MTARPEILARQLDSHRGAFKAFLAARVGSEEEAEDLLQNGLVKALQHAEELRDADKLVPWFYQLLRHAIVDHYRANSSRRRRHDALSEMINALGEDIAAAPPGWQAQLCSCLAGVVDTLPTRQAELLRRIELEGESVQAAAAAMRLTPNHASVTLHRARQALRLRLEAVCGDCTDGACLDCDCAQPHATPP